MSLGKLQRSCKGTTDILELVWALLAIDADKIFTEVASSFLTLDLSFEVVNFPLGTVQAILEIVLTSKKALVIVALTIKLRP
jgi:hypothetical protein